MKIRSVLMAGCLVALTASVARAAQEMVTLVRDGQAACCIVVSEDVLSAAPAEGYERMAADDLVAYLGRISGAQVQMVAAPVDGLLPIFVGKAAGDVVPAGLSEFGDGYFVNVQPDGITLLGESDRATYYAACHLLHELGVRWYAPGEIGECVPERKTLELAVGRTDEAPDYQTRNLWGGERWHLRNRMGGPMIGQGHAFASIMRPYSIEAHPDYYPIVNGKVRQHQVNMSNPEVVQIFADYYAKRFGEGAHSVSFCPDDGLFVDERPESVAMNDGRLDPIFKIPSVTEGLIKFGNAICARLREMLPEDQLGYLGFYVYANYQLPPTVDPDPMLLPIVAPIGFNRYTSIGNPTAPTSMMLKDIILGWAEKCPKIGCYIYNFNLADTAMPFTRRLAWSRDIPNLYRWGLRYCTIESMANWHTMVPGNYVVSRLLWDVEADPQAMLDEFYPRYYGPAAEAMRRYNTVLENAYENSGAYAGCLWSMHRIFTPEVMRQLEAALSEAKDKAKGNAMIERRVQVAEHSMQYARCWFAARDALNRFDLAEAARQSELFLDNYEKASNAFPGFFVRYNRSYYELFHHRSFKDAGRVAREGEIVYKFPDELLAFLDENKTGEKMGLHRPDANTDDWITLRTYSDTIAEQGYPLFRGLIWYRHRFALPPQAGQADELRLWCGGLDDATRVYLNGQDLGQIGTGNFGPAEIEITDALRTEGENVLVLAVDNCGITELGTGGIMRPMLIYRPK